MYDPSIVVFFLLFDMNSMTNQINDFYFLSIFLFLSDYSKSKIRGGGLITLYVSFCSYIQLKILKRFRASFDLSDAKNW